MADTTIVNTPAARDSGSDTGVVVAFIFFLVLVVAGFLWYRYYGLPFAQASTPSSTNINVTIPAAAASDAPTTPAAPVSGTITN